MREFGPVPPGVDLTRPSIARVYDYFLGGNHITEADREAARRVVEIMPDLPAVNGMLLPPKTCAAVQADLRDVAEVLDSVRSSGLLDPNERTAVLMIAVLHFIPHQDDPAGLVARYREALPPGSFLALTHAQDSPRHAQDSHRLSGTVHAARAYSRDVAPIHLRSRTEIAAMLEGWDLVAPGLVPMPDWRPDNPGEGTPGRLHGLAAVARKNTRSPGPRDPVPVEMDEVSGRKGQ